MVKRAFLRIMSPAFSAPGLTGPVRCQACRGLGGGGPEALWSHVLLWIMAVRGSPRGLVYVQVYIQALARTGKLKTLSSQANSRKKRLVPHALLRSANVSGLAKATPYCTFSIFSLPQEVKVSGYRLFKRLPPSGTRTARRNPDTWRRR